MTPPNPSEGAAAIGAAKEMQRLDPGPMAELRRMQPDNPAPAFWRVAVRHDTMRKQNRDKWVHILRILALLTPKGEAPPDGRPPLHDYKRPLGEVLCDGGDPDWKPQGTPPDGVFSERRLVQLLATRREARRVALERAARMIAAKRNPASGIDVTQVARAILWPEDTAPIAEAYFRRLDRAARAQSEESSE
jgi:CRISPR system Cascade subunit CasB